MAESALLLVIQKIGTALAAETFNFTIPLLARKSAAVAALPNDMKMIRNQLELIRAFLEDTGRKGCTDRVIEAWTWQARKLAYDMEDIVDQFIYVVGKHNVQEGSWWCCMKKIAKKPQSLFTLDQIATAIGGIKQQLRELKENKDWTQPIGGVRNDILATEYDSHYVPGQDYSIADDELVGIDKDRKIWIKSLLLEGGPGRRLIALWGMGGIGKSTLVNNLYKSEASKFDCHAWVSVSQSYILEDIWRNMLRGLRKNFKEESDASNMNSTVEKVEKMSSEELQAELKQILGGKRYLIVLDDVWRPQHLQEIQQVLIDNGLGSRAITTTRSEEVAEVAEVAEAGCKIKVEPLDADDAWRLFCRKAFPRFENNICPTELVQCGKDIVNKCGGLPLALVAIGSILSLKVRNVRVWRLFYEQLNWELHNNENLSHVEKILNLSYKYLPNHLKSCFLYCAMFPEDYWIQRKRLIRLWISEGFVPQAGALFLEEVAEGYLEELVQRSMLHVVERNSSGRLRRVQMHDIVRELAISQSKKECFSTTYDDTHVRDQHVGLDSRRVSVLRCKNGLGSSIHPAARLRSLIAFDSTVRSSAPLFPSESKYIAVLELSGLPIDTIPDSVGELFNIKYLGLDRTNVKKLPSSVTKLHNLETLSIRDGQCLSLPRGSQRLKRLRHILIYKMLDKTWSRFRSHESMVPFEGMWDLQELQSLHTVGANKVFVAKLGNLSQMRFLLITEVKSSYCPQLCDSISKLRHLSRLELRASYCEEVLQLDNLTLPKRLDKLTLVGGLSQGFLESPFFSKHGDELVRLELYYSQLVVDPTPCLYRLAKLSRIVLRSAYIGQARPVVANASEISKLRDELPADST
ncbi:disease resistance protein RPM1-like [Triticum dicoccoides]|uniref:disease resistance protein RPM1-like n=1 Tax=Triticum dicoccoides TaxID=85692 RepID=UPI000E795D3C|nr:disease resistance protein RPM1-like [Triticum dicoccoides]XP_037445020.1 disease resistance protein RPM1-like [Triticum dicoccoides]